MTRKELEQVLEASKARRNRRVDEILRDNSVLRDTVYRDQHPQPADKERQPRRTAAFSRRPAAETF